MYRFRGLGANYPAIDAAITQFETGGSSSSIGMRNNNPGNLVYSSWMAPYGCSPGGAGGFATCPTLDAGNQILDYRVSQLVDQGDSVSQLINTWASPSYPGNTQASYQNYVNYVSSSTGLDPNAPISDQLDTSTPGTDFSSTPTDAVVGGGTLDALSLLSSGPNWGPNWALIGLAAGAGLLLLMASS